MSNKYTALIQIDKVEAIDILGIFGDIAWSITDPNYTERSIKLLKKLKPLIGRLADYKRILKEMKLGKKVYEEINKQNEI